MDSPEPMSRPPRLRRAARALLAPIARLLRPSGGTRAASAPRRDSAWWCAAALEQSHEGHLLVDGGRVQSANTSAARLFGVSAPAALVGRTLGELIGGDSVPSRDGVPLETVITADGHGVPVEYTLTTLSEEAGEPGRLQHVVVRDLTAVKKSEAERARFEVQVQEAQKLELLGALARGVAHDLNNLLGVVRGNAELARTAIARGRSNIDNLSAILAASDRAREIVRQLLTFTRRSTPTREYVNLSQLVLDLQPLLRRMIPRTVQLTIEGTENPHPIMGDPTQLQQLLLNLVLNASYAMRTKTKGVLTVALSARKVTELGVGLRDFVVVKVQDTGEGMTDEVRARLFEPFFTSRPAGEETGLGMSVVHGIVVAHEGRADVSSEKGSGTTCEIRFPRAAIEELWDEGFDPALVDEMANESMRTDESDGVMNPEIVDSSDIDVLEESPFAGTTVVVVDDEPAVAYVVERALQHFGHVVHAFNHPEQALQFIRQQPSSVDLLITDQTMPGLTGDQLAEAVHTLRSDLPVLILTGFSQRLTPERVAAARMHAVLLKPIELSELRRHVNEALSANMLR